MAYRLALPMSLIGILDVLVVSLIRRDNSDFRYVLDCLDFRVESGSTIAQDPVRILGLLSQVAEESGCSIILDL